MNKRQRFRVTHACGSLNWRRAVAALLFLAALPRRLAQKPKHHGGLTRPCRLRQLVQGQLTVRLTLGDGLKLFSLSIKVYTAKVMPLLRDINLTYSGESGGINESQEGTYSLSAR